MRTRALLLSLVLPVALLAISCKDGRRVTGPQFRTSCGEDCPPAPSPEFDPPTVSIAGDGILSSDYCSAYLANLRGGSGSESRAVTWTIPDTRVVQFQSLTEDNSKKKELTTAGQAVWLCGVWGGSNWNYGYSSLQAAWAGAVANVDLEFAPTGSGLQPRRVQVLPRAGSSTTIVRTRTSQLDAIGIDQFGTQRVKTATAIWASDNPNVVLVYSRETPNLVGVVKGISRGSAGITAAVNGASSPPTTVTVLAVTSVVVTPANWTAVPGWGLRFTAKPKDQNGADLPWTASWSSSNTSVVTVEPSTGVATAVALGTANIVATADGVSATASVTVVPPPTLTSLTTDPSPAIQYTPFTFIVEGTGFDPASAELEIVGDSLTNCFVATSIPCEVPVYGPYQVTSTRLVSAPRTFSGWGPYRVFVRNLATGAVSNQVSFRIEPRYEY